MSAELPVPDRAQLLREVEAQALRDSQSDWSGVAPADVPPGPVNREIDRWTEQRLARIAVARSADERAARERIRSADAAETVADERRTGAEEAVAAAERRHREIAAVLRGERRGHDGGDWSDAGRMTEDRRRKRVTDGLVYGGAAVAEVGLNFLAFRLMGASPVETALLAGAVVLVTVLLPKQLGTVVSTARRTGRWVGWPLAATVIATGLWVGVTVFVALVRTAYLLLPVGSGPALLTVAGVGPMVLTAGWLAVSLAVGLAVLIRSVHRHNPYVSAWHAAGAQLVRLVRARSAAREEAARAVEGTAAERDDLRATADRYDPLVDECRALAAELKDRYAHALGRRRSSVEQREPRPLPAPADGAAA